MKTQILMSTYNGERYLREQLNSILNQNIKNCQLLIRDDGSQDNTRTILEEYAQRFEQITYYAGENIGVQKSYFNLIEHADPNADYIAFSDQDDIWLPEKVSQAIAYLEINKSAPDVPLLYCSAQRIVDEQLNPVKMMVSREIHFPSFGNALVQNVCTGCTAVVNQKLIEMIREHQPKHFENIVMHDWWLYLTASCFGFVYYDNRAYIKYRQHENNAHGAISDHWKLMKYRLGQLCQPRGEIYRQAEEFYECYAEILHESMYASNIQLLKKLCSSQKGICNKLRLVCDKRIYRQKPGDDFVYRGIVLMGKL